MHNFYETIMQTAEEGENSSQRYRNVCEGITKIQCSRPVGCIEKKNGILVVLGNAVFCYVEVEDEFYRISTTYKECVQMSQTLWEIEGEIVSCYKDMPDECIGEVERLVQCVEKELF